MSILRSTTHDDTLAENNRQIAAAAVPATALAEAITLTRARQFGAFPHSSDYTESLRIALQYGGDVTTARALHFRILALDMLLRADEDVMHAAAKLAPIELADILAALPITSSGTSLGVDGDNLASAIRAAVPVGTA